MEQTLVLLKPDAVQRGIMGRVIQRFEDAGLKIIAARMVWADKKTASEHYSDVAKRRGKKVFNYNVGFISEGPVLALVIEGIEAVEAVRKIVGSTEPKSAPPGTIRGDFAHISFSWSDKKKKVVRNIIHASSSVSDAAKEIAIWFRPDEIHSYKTANELHTL